jgi:hypothetical protein
LTGLHPVNNDFYFSAAGGRTDVVKGINFVVSKVAETTLIKASGEDRPRIKSTTLKVIAEHDVENFVVQFPFPRCKRKE